MLKLQQAAILILAIVLTACNAAHGPVLDRGTKPPDVKGTISGLVRTAGGAPVSGRKVTAENLTNGQKYTTTFTAPGRYTLFCTRHPVTMHAVVDVGGA